MNGNVHSQIRTRVETVACDCLVWFSCRHVASTAWLRWVWPFSWLNVTPSYAEDVFPLSIFSVSATGLRVRKTTSYCLQKIVRIDVSGRTRRNILLTKMTAEPQYLENSTIDVFPVVTVMFQICRKPTSETLQSVQRNMTSNLFRELDTRQLFTYFVDYVTCFYCMWNHVERQLYFLFYDRRRNTIM